MYSDATTVIKNLKVHGSVMWHFERMGMNEGKHNYYINYIIYIIIIYIHIYINCYELYSY